jgi:hypothetical protein
MAKFPKTGLLRDVTWSCCMSCGVITEQLISKAELLGGFCVWGRNFAKSSFATTGGVHQERSNAYVATYKRFNLAYARFSRCRQNPSHRSALGTDRTPFSSWLPSWVIGTINTHSLPFRVGLSVRSTPIQCPSQLGCRYDQHPFNQPRAALGCKVLSRLQNMAILGTF